jgi:hypothetical protein
MYECDGEAKVKDATKDNVPCPSENCNDATCCKVNPVQRSTVLQGQSYQCDGTTNIKDVNKNSGPCPQASWNDATCCKANTVLCSTISQCDNSSRVKDTSKNSVPYWLKKDGNESGN